jgi:hypothetical protein
MKLDSLKDVQNDPRFKVLLAKADTHLSIHRPKEYAELKKSGKLQGHLESNTLQAWNNLNQYMDKGLHRSQAEELSLGPILPPSEQQEEEESAEQTASQ